MTRVYVAEKEIYGRRKAKLI